MMMMMMIMIMIMMMSLSKVSMMSDLWGSASEVKPSLPPLLYLKVSMPCRQ